MVETIQQASVDVDRARLLIVADTHGYIDSRIAGLSRSCDVAIHAGDILVAQVLDELQPKHGLIYAVRGNNDRGRGRQLESLPDQCLLSLPGGTLCVEHGHRIWDTKNYHLRLRRSISIVALGQSCTDTRINLYVI